MGRSRVEFEGVLLTLRGTLHHINGIVHGWCWYCMQGVVLCLADQGYGRFQLLLGRGGLSIQIDRQLPYRVCTTVT
jgi:hypothetical protein